MVNESIVTVGVHLAPEFRQIIIVSVPQEPPQNGEVGLFVIISRMKHMQDHGVFHLYLGSHPSIADAELFVKNNSHIFGWDLVVIEVEKIENIDAAISHMNKMTLPDGIVDPRNVFFFATNSKPAED